ncbi:hypothetical protein OE88DRAFT_395555 [Heliocybe sulcata]|uniref:Uncharacterized protein n=1 Tax=Heliocybe sulcata TaxID=5364 RepID=A0A5C3MW65_9AGAM|nr:hypothetical protein OE88DRAFT_395555 [Heliocybe sulcata]
MQFMKFCGRYRQFEPESTYDWPGFRKAVFGHQGNKFFPITLPYDKMVLQAVDVSSMVEEIVKFMKDEMNVAASAWNMAALRSAVAAASDHRQCEYHVMFAFRQPGTDEVFFFSLVSSIALGRTPVGYSAEIDAMKFLVLEGFKDPA